MMPPTHLRAAMAALLAYAGLETLTAPWLDAAVVLLWVAGGLADYLWHRDRDGDGRPDGVQWTASRLGWSVSDTESALAELRRIGPGAVRWLTRIDGVRDER